LVNRLLRSISSPLSLPSGVKRNPTPFSEFRGFPKRAGEVGATISLPPVSGQPGSAKDSCPERLFCRAYLRGLRAFWRAFSRAGSQRLCAERSLRAYGVRGSHAACVFCLDSQRRSCSFKTCLAALAHARAFAHVRLVRSVNVVTECKSWVLLRLRFAPDQKPALPASDSIAIMPQPLAKGLQPLRFAPDQKPALPASDSIAIMPQPLAKGLQPLRFAPASSIAIMKPIKTLLYFELRFAPASSIAIMPKAPGQPESRCGLRPHQASL